MPSTYAHYRLGQQVRRKLEGNERKIIEKYPQLYLIGLHGPDILFYYKPLRPNPVNQIGYDLHGHSGKEFFERAKNIINSQKEKEPFLAYTYGVLWKIVPLIIQPAFIRKLCHLIKHLVLYL